MSAPPARALSPDPATTASDPPRTADEPLRPSTFSSLRTRNFRLFAMGQLVSNTGSWVQRIAQDWVVLTITGSATAVGITTMLQFLPTLLFGLHGGLLADRYSKRHILIVTQIGLAAMATTLAVLTLSNRIDVWHVYLVAFGLGVIVALDNPARQAFVNEMVGPRHLLNAISLNASIFQLGALIGPAVSGVLIGLVGPGYAFTINAVSYLAPISMLVLIRRAELHLSSAPASGQHAGAGLLAVLRRPEMLWPTVIASVFGVFTINLPVTLAAYAKTVFHSGSAGYGYLCSTVAVGSVVGALISARRSRTTLRSIAGVGAALAVTEMLAAAAPGQVTFCILLFTVGAATLLLLTAANSAVQMTADASTRGRIMSVYLVVFIGSGAIGGPVLGFIDQRFGPQVGMLLAGALPATVTGVIAVALARRRGLRLHLQLDRPRGWPITVVPAGGGPARRPTGATRS